MRQIVALLLLFFYWPLIQHTLQGSAVHPKTSRSGGDITVMAIQCVLNMLPCYTF